MSKIVYGVFDTPAQADQALERIGRGPKSGDATAVSYDHEPSGEELSLAATRTVRWTLAAMAVVGFLGATAMSILAPLKMGVEFGLADFFFVWGGGTVFGMVAGAVSGMAEPLQELERPMALARAGKALVLVDDGDDATVDKLREQGAVVAYAA